MPVYTITVPEDTQAGLLNVIRQFLEQSNIEAAVELQRRGDHQLRSDDQRRAGALVRSSSASVTTGETSQTRALTPSASLPRIINQARRDLDGVISLTETMTEDISGLQDNVEAVSSLKSKFESISRWQTAAEEEQATNRDTRESVKNMSAAFKVVGATIGIMLAYYLFNSLGATFISIFLMLSYIGTYFVLRGYRIPVLN